MVQLRLLIETKNQNGETFKNKLYFNTKEALEEYLNNIKNNKAITIIDYESELIVKE